MALQHSQQVDSDASDSGSASPNASPEASANASPEASPNASPEASPNVASENVAADVNPPLFADNDIYADKSSDSESDKWHKSGNDNASNKSHESNNDEDAEKSNESDNDDGKRAPGTAALLFGEELSSSDNDDDDDNGERNVNKNLSRTIDSGDEEEQQSNKDDEITGPRLYSDPEEGPEETEEIVAPTRIDLEMARCRSNLGREGPLFVKFPNFLSVDTKPFDAETYEDEAEDDINMDDEGRTRLKLKIENTIRWRMSKDNAGNDVKESNAKIVRWSDGTMSLYLGSEIFDVEKQKVMDHNHLFIRQGAGLQAQAVFTDKLVFRPHSTETMTHRKMTMNMADKSNKAQKVKVIGSVGDNPESQKQELIRKEEERLRATARRESQQRKMRDRPRTSGLSSGFLEGYESDEGGNGESLAAIKRKYQSNYRNLEQSVFGSSSDEEETEAEKAKRIGEAKIDSDESAASSSDLDTSHQKHAKRKIVIDEEDDEED